MHGLKMSVDLGASRVFEEGQCSVALPEVFDVFGFAVGHVGIDVCLHGLIGESVRPPYNGTVDGLQCYFLGHDRDCGLRCVAFHCYRPLVFLGRHEHFDLADGAWLVCHRLVAAHDFIRLLAVLAQQSYLVLS